MRACLKKARQGLGGLTAAMVFVTGIPHFECRCPDGNIKKWCFGIACTPEGCCCGDESCCCHEKGSCCSCPGESPDSEGQARSCAHQPTASGQWDDRGCIRTLQQGDPIISSSPKSDVLPESPALVAIPCSSHTPVPQRLNVSNTWRIPLTPPPTELIILFEHFLI